MPDILKTSKLLRHPWRMASATALALCFAAALQAQDIPVFAKPKPPAPAAAPSPAGQGGATGKPGFYGIELEGASIAFLLDTSGSMSGSKLERLKSEMRRIAAGLKKPGKDSKVSENGIYKIFVFNSGKPTKFPSEGAARVGAAQAFDKATQFVDGLQSTGGTDMLNAWGFLLDDYGTQPLNTIYFLSDGEPSDCQPPQLLELLRRRNPVGKDGARKSKIHCVSIGQASQLLKDIAEENGGQYLEVR